MIVFFPVIEEGDLILIYTTLEQFCKKCHFYILYAMQNGIRQEEKNMVLVKYQDIKCAKYPTGLKTMNLASYTTYVDTG